MEAPKPKKKKRKSKTKVIDAGNDEEYGIECHDSDGEANEDLDEQTKKDRKISVKLPSFKKVLELTEELKRKFP